MMLPASTGIHVRGRLRAPPHAGLTKKTSIVRDTLAILLALVLTPGLAAAVRAQEPGPMAARLSAEKVGGVEPGSYSAGEKLAFSIDPYGDKFLLRFDGNPEAFVLTGDRVALGGRVLKYDTGATVLRISIWGGMTLYTDSSPEGLPVTRTGDFTSPPREPVSEAELLAALNDEAAHLTYVDQMHLRFSAGDVAGGEQARALAFDALANAQTGIERLVATPSGRQAFSRKIDSVRIVEGAKPGLTLSGRTLLVHFVPADAEAGRASSRAVSQELGKLLAINEPG